MAEPGTRESAAAGRSLPGWIVLPAAAGLIAIVAFASRSGSGAAGPAGVGVDLGPVLTAIRVIGYVALALGVVALPLALVAARARSRRGRPDDGRTTPRELAPIPWWARLLGIAVMAAMFAFQVVVVMAYIAELRRAAARAGNPQGSGDEPALDPGALGAAGQDLSALIIAAVIVVVLGVLIAAIAIRWRLLDRQEFESPGPDAPDGTVEAIELSLEALRAEPDPRRAVIAAYAAMERSLSGAGLGRRRSEAPLEYLRRVLAAPARAAEEIRTITVLFQRAKFSPHAIDESMRMGAIDALERVRITAGGAG